MGKKESVWKKIEHGAIAFTGHTMLTKYPPWVVYKPDIHRVRGKDVRSIIGVLEPGDILLRSFDGYLNTIFTPGFWGHGAIYLGSNEIGHAIGTGTCTEDILDFCRCDAVAVLELEGADRERIVTQARLLSSMHIGYDYDFMGTNDTYYCTEYVDISCDHAFNAVYKMIGGHRALTPDAIFNFYQIRKKLTINYEEK